MGRGLLFTGNDCYLRWMLSSPVEVSNTVCFSHDMLR